VGSSFAFLLLIWILFGIAGGLQGRAKGSSFLLWFAISAAVPFFGFIASIVYPGREHEPRRKCDTCGRLLPVSDTMCMRCGTDLAYPDVVYVRRGNTIYEVERAPRADAAGESSPPPATAAG
jgi:hypothetical protein